MSGLSVPAVPRQQREGFALVRMGLGRSRMLAGLLLRGNAGRKQPLPSFPCVAFGSRDGPAEPGDSPGLRV